MDRLFFFIYGAAVAGLMITAIIACNNIKTSLEIPQQIDSIKIYQHFSRNTVYYDIDINNISYDSISNEEMRKAVKEYPKSIYK